MESVSMMGWDAAAKVWRQVVVNADGKLIIDPSEIFEDTPTDGETGKAANSNWAHDHAADASAHHSRYSDAEARAAVNYTGTKYWSCPGSHFDALHPDIDDIDKAGAGAVTITGNNIQLTCGVFLPHGAIITKAVIYGNAGAGDTPWDLRRVKLSDNTDINIATALINSEDTTVAEGVVDNEIYEYSFYTNPLQAADEVYGARIAYHFE